MARNAGSHRAHTPVDIGKENRQMGRERDVDSCQGSLVVRILFAGRVGPRILQTTWGRRECHCCNYGRHKARQARPQRCPRLHLANGATVLVEPMLSPTRILVGVESSRRNCTKESRGRNLGGKFAPQPLFALTSSKTRLAGLVNPTNQYRDASSPPSRPPQTTSPSKPILVSSASTAPSASSEERCVSNCRASFGSRGKPISISLSSRIIGRKSGEKGHTWLKAVVMNSMLSAGSNLHGRGHGTE